MSEDRPLTKEELAKIVLGIEPKVSKSKVEPTKVTKAEEPAKSMLDDLA